MVGPTALTVRDGGYPRLLAFVVNLHFRANAELIWAMPFILRARVRFCAMRWLEAAPRLTPHWRECDVISGQLTDAAEDETSRFKMHDARSRQTRLEGRIRRDRLLPVEDPRTRGASSAHCRISAGVSRRSLVRSWSCISFAPGRSHSGAEGWPRFRNHKRAKLRRLGLRRFATPCEITTRWRCVYR
jgi:hypothetical protein